MSSLKKYHRELQWREQLESNYGQWKIQENGMGTEGSWQTADQNIYR